MVKDQSFQPEQIDTPQQNSLDETETNNQEGTEQEIQNEIDSVEEVPTKTRFSGVGQQHFGLFDSTTQIIDTEVTIFGIIFCIESNSINLRSRIFHAILICILFHSH